MTWTLRNLHNSQKKVLVDITIWLALSPYGDMALFTSFEYIIGEYYRYSILPLHQNLHNWKEGNRSCRYKWQKFVCNKLNSPETNFVPIRTSVNKNSKMIVEKQISIHISLKCIVYKEY
ncbi:ANM_HP_G0021550.mRNA.1.CDS.1 [Saccharomyces cerevisiae]|nr:ANM_HP_G0103480.mRNA.1.CDS.1 [Saccharomyces cerevisiae]CAI4955137.1 ANM_HP_G0129580.mRNA.1.CDS.1 [Saccharomyces cerevisiae]CAI5207983.1 ANM_HP_G0263410.mRNA.1.CDS.1 [Saccharomyces cerevisiae]CAI5213742.1 ANM_HP_G0013500.mRNA.1.CDS.1 [Saccharomyces cerevisiae]CAI5216384.1 ANM_HP_G0021550.mRNA.1.CDS.1 [Saccharomyces cerevisiae]